MGTFQSMAPGYPGGTSDYYTTPYPVALGTEARDGAGNKFVFCNTGSVSTCAPEQCVMIRSDWSITPVVASGRGQVGVIADLTKSGNTSAPVSPIPINTGVWVQIYGRAFVQVAGGGSSASDAMSSLLTSAALQFKIPTTLAASPPGQLAFTTDTQAMTTIASYYIVGMTLAFDASVGDVSAITSVTQSHGGSRAAVWLNYPQIDAIQVPSST